MRPIPVYHVPSPLRLAMNTLALLKSIGELALRHQVFPSIIRPVLVGRVKLREPSFSIHIQHAPGGDELSDDLLRFTLLRRRGLYLLRVSHSVLKMVRQSVWVFSSYTFGPSWALPCGAQALSAGYLGR